MSGGLQDLLVIITDSRGRGLQNFIDAHDLENDFTIVLKTIRGCDLRRAASIVRTLLPRYSHRNYYCIVSVGICSFTEKAKSKSKRSITYPLNAREQKVESAIQIISDLKAEFGSRINFPTIIPASLGKFYSYFNPNRSSPSSLEEEQIALVADLKTVNEKIKQGNQELPTTTINLCNRFFSSSIKINKRKKSRTKRRVEKFNDSQLFDGLHLSPEARPACFSLYFESATRDLHDLRLTTEGLSQDSSVEESASDSELPDWDFKRRTLEVPAQD
jgi:hypothetical protein